MSEDGDGSKKPRRSRVLENMRLTGKDKTASSVVGNLFVRFGPETQDRIGDELVGATRQEHFREELIAALKAIGVRLKKAAQPLVDDVA